MRAMRWVALVIVFVFLGPDVAFAIRRGSMRPPTAAEKQTAISGSRRKPPARVRMILLLHRPILVSAPKTIGPTGTDWRFEGWDKKPKK
jgi:hypothetical protein